MTTYGSQEKTLDEIVASPLTASEFEATLLPDDCFFRVDITFSSSQGHSYVAISNPRQQVPESITLYNESRHGFSRTPSLQEFENVAILVSKSANEARPSSSGNIQLGSTWPVSFSCSPGKSVLTVAYDIGLLYPLTQDCIASFARELEKGFSTVRIYAHYHNVPAKYADKTGFPQEKVHMRALAN